jgi:Domain of unknown function (DUF1707)
MVIRSHDRRDRVTADTRSRTEGPGGYASNMAEDARAPAVRASDAERERVLTRLRDAAAEGRLTFEELADRVEAAARAVTRSDLDRLTEDLPAEPPATRSPEPAPVPTRASSVFADVRRAGAWTVPAAGKWESLFGDVVLDVREARVTGAEVRIDAGSIFGNIDLLVPEGVEVESARARCSATSSRRPGKPLRRARPGSCSPGGRCSATCGCERSGCGSAWPRGSTSAVAGGSSSPASLSSALASSRRAAGTACGRPGRAEA